MEHITCIESKNFRKNDFDRFVIVADIGGEHSQVAIMGIKAALKYSIIFKKTLLTKDIAKIYDLLNDCLKDAYEKYHIEIGRAIIAAAGPVSRRRGYIKLTSVDLTIDTQEILDNSLLHKVILLNDFEAIGYGLDTLDMSKDVVLLDHIGEDFTVPDDKSNTFAVIGAGNGLGMTIAYMDKARHIHVPLPSEGGHENLPIQSELEFELLQYLKEHVLPRKHAHPELERVISSKGIINIYNFLRSKKIHPESIITKKIDSLEASEKLEAIEKNISDPTCKETIELFIRFYARAARNLALMSECYSGLFIVGGRALRFMEYFNDGLFMEEFEMHDQRTDVLRKVPVYLIKNTDVGLYGCCNVAVNFYNLM